VLACKLFFPWLVVDTERALLLARCVYLIRCKNLCKCHNAPLLSTTIKKRKEIVKIEKKREEEEEEDGKKCEDHSRQKTALVERQEENTAFKELKEILSGCMVIHFEYDTF
jgi:hypothetical protein